MIERYSFSQLTKRQIKLLPIAFSILAGLTFGSSDFALAARKSTDRPQCSEIFEYAEDQAAIRKLKLTDEQRRRVLRYIELLRKDPNAVADVVQIFGNDASSPAYQLALRNVGTRGSAPRSSDSLRQQPTSYRPPIPATIAVRDKTLALIEKYFDLKVEPYAIDAIADYRMNLPSEDLARFDRFMAWISRQLSQVGFMQIILATAETRQKHFSDLDAYKLRARAAANWRYLIRYETLRVNERRLATNHVRKLKKRIDEGEDPNSPEFLAEIESGAAPLEAVLKSIRNRPPTEIDMPVLVNLEHQLVVPFLTEYEKMVVEAHILRVQKQGPRVKVLADSRVQYVLKALHKRRKHILKVTDDLFTLKSIERMPHAALREILFGQAKLPDQTELRAIYSLFDKDLVPHRKDRVDNQSDVQLPPHFYSAPTEADEAVDTIASYFRTHGYLPVIDRSAAGGELHYLRSMNKLNRPDVSKAIERLEPLLGEALMKASFQPWYKGEYILARRIELNLKPETLTTISNKVERLKELFNISGPQPQSTSAKSLSTIYSFIVQHGRFPVSSADKLLPRTATPFQPGEDEIYKSAQDAFDLFDDFAPNSWSADVRADVSHFIAKLKELVERHGEHGLRLQRPSKDALGMRNQE